MIRRANESVSLFNSLVSTSTESSSALVFGSAAAVSDLTDLLSSNCCKMLEFSFNCRRANIA
jgi:hypothetical protein